MTDLTLLRRDVQRQREQRAAYIWRTTRTGRFFLRILGAITSLGNGIIAVSLFLAALAAFILRPAQTRKSLLAVVGLPITAIAYA